MLPAGERQNQRNQVKLLWSVVAAAACLMVFSASAAPLENREVSVYVTVEQGDGLVRGLTAQNFRLFEDGRAQAFRLEQPETPAKVALLFEYSLNSAMFYEDIEAAMEGFLAQAREGDWYALATFDHELHVQQDFTRQIGRIRQAFEEMPQSEWNETDTYDAIYDMLDKMARLSGRRVMIVVASGNDTFSRYTYGEVQKKIDSSNVTIFSVGLGTMLRGMYDPYLSQMGRMDLLQAQNFLRTLADESGGDSWFPNEQGAYSDIMKGIMQTLANQYRLVYSPERIEDGKLHKIEVQAFQVENDKRHDFKVRVRKGWRF